MVTHAHTDEDVQLSEHDHSGVEGCAICGAYLPFDFPTKLLEEVIARRVVIFAGAGISTESPKVFPRSLYEEARRELDIGPEEDPSFARVMSLFEAAHGRTALLQLIRSRLDYIRSFPELMQIASQFHTELGPVYLIHEVVTTNWDSLFEDFAGSTSIVVPEDYSFWNLPSRKVFKIHGSLGNLGSIVATEADYEQCRERLEKGVIGATLKHLLATKTVVFIGYSLTDSDFLQVYEFLRKELAHAAPKAYFVTLETSPEVAEKMQLDIVRTDGVFFIRELKRLLVEEGVMLSDRIYEDAFAQRSSVRDAHSTLLSKTNFTKYPHAVYSAAYQDGLMHGFERLLSHRGTGEYSDPHRLYHLIQDYLEVQRAKRKARNYWDVAYIEGYTNALLFPVGAADDAPNPPRFFAFGVDSDIYSYSQFMRTIRKGESLHKAAYRKAQKIIEIVDEGRLEAHHPPFL